MQLVNQLNESDVKCSGRSSSESEPRSRLSSRVRRIWLPKWRIFLLFTVTKSYLGYKWLLFMCEKFSCEKWPILRVDSRFKTSWFPTGSPSPSLKNPIHDDSFLANLFVNEFNRFIKNNWLITNTSDINSHLSERNVYFSEM